MFCEHNAKARKEGLCAKCAELKPYIQFKTCKEQCFACKQCGWFYGPGAGEDKAGKPVPERERSLSSIYDETPPPGWQPSDQELQRMKDEPYLDLDAHLGGEQEEQSGLAWLRKEQSRPTVEAIKKAIQLEEPKLYKDWCVGRPDNWKCDQQTKDMLCLGGWLDDELQKMVSLGVISDADRKIQHSIFHRWSRSRTDLYELVVEIINDTIDGKIERERVPHHRWG